MLLHIQPGKPTQNAYVERFNRTVRHECFDLNLFETFEHAQHLATKWLWSYNNERPHKANGGLPPVLYQAMFRVVRITGLGFIAIQCFIASPDSHAIFFTIFLDYSIIGSIGHNFF